MAMTTQELLDDAMAQYHALNTGRMARVVTDQNGEKVEFTAANKAGLLLYIQSLQSMIPAAGSVPDSTPAPLQFTF